MRFAFVFDARSVPSLVLTQVVKVSAYCGSIEMDYNYYIPRLPHPS